MAVVDMKFMSKCLKRPVTFKMFLPIDPPEWMSDIPALMGNAPIKTLILLHGYTGDGDNWVPEDLSWKYNVAVVCPNGENGFWLDGISSGHQYATFLGEELIGVLRNTYGLAKTPEETGVLGLSMGGFGALHTALAYPSVYGAAGAMSSALIMYEVAKMQPGGGNSVANYEYYRECFGEPDQLMSSKNNPEQLVRDIQTEGKAFPRIYMACGTEDFLLEPNRRFHQFLLDNAVSHEYMESAGGHTMEFWQEYTRKIIPWMFG